MPHIGTGIRQNAFGMQFHRILRRNFNTGIGLGALLVHTTVAGATIVAFAHEIRGPDRATFAASITQLLPFFFRHFKNLSELLKGCSLCDN